MKLFKRYSYFENSFCYSIFKVDAGTYGKCMLLPLASWFVLLESCNVFVPNKIGL